MRTTLTAFLAFTLVAAAHASDEEDNLAGTWAFQAEVQEGCEFSGTAQLRRAATYGLYTCEMTVRDICQGNEAIVRQSCVVTQANDTVNIQAFIEEFFTEPSGNYAPDNFSLTFDSETGEMHGALDSYGIWKAVWKRAKGAVS